MEPGKKILIVEDEADLRKLVVENLKEAGYDVYEAADGREGLALVKSVRPNVIISDILMPVMDGNQFLKEVRKTNLGYYVPFIVLTARAKMKDYFEVMNVDDFIEKPFSTEELLARVKKVLWKAQVRNAPKPKGRPLAEEPGPDDKTKLFIPEETGVIIEEKVTSNFGSNKGIDVSAPAAPSVFSRWKKRKEASSRRKKVLIIEDDIAVYGELQAVFVGQGYLAEVVSTPAQCFENVARLAPDIIITKYAHFEMKADMLVSVLRGMSMTANIPIIVYSHDTKGVYAYKVLGAGANAFLSTPKTGELLSKTRELLKV